MKRSVLFFVLCLMMFQSIGQSNTSDFRDRRNGKPIFSNGYIDQPYVVVLDSGEWLCVFTTAKGAEGSRGQHIASTISSDQGKSWSEPVRIEEPSAESASWAMPYKTSYGRVYVFYDYNGDKIHHLNEQKNIHEDIIGWYCFKYTDDGGKSWSKRYRLPVNITAVDRNNDWGGKVQMFWGIGKPINLGRKGMMFAFTKLGRYMLDDGEGWFMRCDNINTERNPEKLHWKNLPEGDNGLRNPAFGPVQEEHNIVELSNGTLYCVFRTVMGYVAESYSYDQGKTWTNPAVPTYYSGQPIKNPRACPRLFKTANGKYLFWHHVNSGRDFGIRNPAWVSGGVERDGKIIWSQPEILVYAPGLQQERMSYPDLIEQDGKYWITETNKSEGMCHAIDPGFLNALWNQFTRDSITRQGLVIDDHGNDIIGKEYKLPQVVEPSKGKGFTIDIVSDITRLREGEIICQSTGSDGRFMRLEMGSNYALKFTMSDGVKSNTWSSDAGVIPFIGTSEITLVVDFQAKIIHYVINGVFNDGGTERLYGWARLDGSMGAISSDSIRIGNIKTGGEHREKNVVKAFRFYDRPLMVTECVGNYRSMKGGWEMMMD